MRLLICTIIWLLLAGSVDAQLQESTFGIPKDLATIDGMASGSVSLMDVQAAQRLDSPKGLLILSFTLYIERPDMLVSHTSSSYYITSNMKKALEGVRVGDKVYFGLIKAKNPDGDIVELPNVQLYIGDLADSK